MLTRLSIFKLAILTPLINAHDEQRRILTPTENIGHIIRSQRANGRARGFSIHAEKPDGTELAFNVVEASNPALTADTIFNNSPIGSDMLHTLLVSDVATDAETFALLAVDPDDNVQGIVDAKGNRPYKIRQKKGGKATAVEEENLTPPDWECGVHDSGVLGRKLEGEEEKHHHDHDHEHHDHHNHHHHDMTIDSAMESLTKQLRGTKINPLNKPRRLQSSSSYNYQVDLYMEIDNAFVTRSGGTEQSALNYINSLVTAANVVYEREIDTHLHVAVVDLNTVYDASTSTSDALTIMRNTYAAGSWHTAGIDLHHALLGKGLGGGIAYVGVLCRSDYGYGLTASIGGSFESLDKRVVWDLVAFMHEIGHNFNSPHTHDTNAYNPAVDTCGTSCPASSTNQKWSTIMSYCHLCSGGYANQMYSFGGLYDGSGTKTDISNWINNADLEANYDSVRSSYEPHRVSHRMYNHVASRGNCLAVPTVVTPSPTKAPVTPSPVSSKPTNAPMSSSPTRSPTTSAPVTSPPTDAPVSLPPTDAPITAAPVTLPPTDAPVTAAPVTPQPTKAPTTPSPTRAPVTQPPTISTNCEDPNITQQLCIAAPNCEWVKYKGSRFCRFASNPPSPTPPSPTTPNPTNGGGGGGGGQCLPYRASCDPNNDNCCTSCATKGRWVNTCK